MYRYNYVYYNVYRLYKIFNNTNLHGSTKCNIKENVLIL